MAEDDDAFRDWTKVLSSCIAAHENVVVTNKNGVSVRYVIACIGVCTFIIFRSEVLPIWIMRCKQLLQYKIRYIYTIEVLELK